MSGYGFKSALRNTVLYHLKTHIPEQAPEAVKFTDLNKSSYRFQGLYGYDSLKFIDNKDLIDPENKLYCYNACVVRDTINNNIRLFYRTGQEPKGYEDMIASCLLESEDDITSVVPDTNIYLQLHSDWDETMSVKEHLKKLLPYRYIPGKHVEDPCVVLFNNHWFVFYTDGINVAVAKVSLDCKTTFYSHYLLPDGKLKNIGNDGREKNWSPIVDNHKLYLLYSDNPRGYYECFDTLNCLQTITPFALNYTVSSNYGAIRGGTASVEYDNMSYMMIFHTVQKLHVHDEKQYVPVYSAGAYLFYKKEPYHVHAVLKFPLIIGIPSHVSGYYSLQNNVVYPRGIIRSNNNSDKFIISLGINDYKIAFLTIDKKDLIWEHSKQSDIYGKLSNPLRLM
jgi:predicted GH43/DUF377 family glycosyl hydrolase